MYLGSSLTDTVFPVFTIINIRKFRTMLLQLQYLMDILLSIAVNPFSHWIYLNDSFKHIIKFITFLFRTFCEFSYLIIFNNKKVVQHLYIPFSAVIVLILHSSNSFIVCYHFIRVFISFILLLLTFIFSILLD